MAASRFDRDGERLRAIVGYGGARVHGPVGIRDTFVIVLCPGWCWMGGRVLRAAMAATPVEDGTRLAWAAGSRLPGGGLLHPFTRRALDRALQRLQRHVLERCLGGMNRCTRNSRSFMGHDHRSRPVLHLGAPRTGGGVTRRSTFWPPVDEQCTPSTRTGYHKEKR